MDVVEDIGVVVVRACVIGLPRATVSRGSPMTATLAIIRVYTRDTRARVAP